MPLYTHDDINKMYILQPTHDLHLKDNKMNLGDSSNSLDFFLHAILHVLLLYIVKYRQFFQSSGHRASTCELSD